MKGVNFGGVEDKQYARLPNDGTVCAFPGCRLGKDIPNGYPARFALGDPTLWCHRECADAWEQRPRPAAEPEPEDKPKCGAPHPELTDFLCAKDEGHEGNYHNSGDGKSWYMEPAQVTSLKEAIVKRNESLDQPETALIATSTPPPQTEDVVADLETRDAELIKREDVVVSDPFHEEGRVSHSGLSLDLKSIDAKLREASDGLVGFKAEPINPSPTDPVVTNVLEVVNIFRKHGVSQHPELINDLIAWKKASWLS